MSKVTVHFDTNIARIDRESIERLLQADARHSGGDDRDADAHIYFESYAQLHAALTPNRLELFQQVRKHPAKSIRALTEASGRDYRRVHEDVIALAGLGLVERVGTAVRALYDVIDIKLGSQDSETRSTPSTASSPSPAPACASPTS